MAKVPRSRSIPRSIPEDDDFEVRVRRKSPWGKMSDKLKSVAEPWVSRLSPNPTAVEMTVVYDVSSRIWNASRTRKPLKRASELKEVNLIMARLLPDLPLAERRRLIDAIYERAKTDHPDDPRFIVDVEVEDRGGGDFHVQVASAEP